MKTQITKVSIFQNAKFLSVLYIPIGLFYALIGLVFIATGLDYLIFTGIIFLLAPIWLTAIMYMMIVIFAVIYNFVASKIGGIEFELTEIPDNKEFSKDDFEE
jgi:hypothetical protein